MKFSEHRSATSWSQQEDTFDTQFFFQNCKLHVHSSVRTPALDLMPHLAPPRSATITPTVTQVSEIRSAVAREACRCVAVLARGLTDHFGALAELWLPELLRNTTRAVIVAAAGDEAARAMFG